MEELLAEINRKLRNYGAEFVPDSGWAARSLTTVSGSISGKAVRIEFAVNNEHPDFDHTVWVYESSTGKAVGRGNGGSNPTDAIDNYHWNGVLADLHIERS